MNCTNKQGGLTLLELMVGISVLAIILSIGVPGFQSIMQSSRATSIANDLLGHLQLARSEAVRRAQTVTLCPSSDGENCDGSDWEVGWLLLADPSGVNEALRVSPPLHNSASLVNGPEEIVFTTVGTTANSSIFTLTVGGQTRQICIEASGRSAVGDCL